MLRDIRRLAEDKFDVLIIGSGIYGAFLAREASLRGLSVALIDRGDFGSATTANSLKIVHGGLRYLQQLNLTRMRESIRARRQFLTIAPYLVRPQQFLIPTYGYGMQSRLVMRIGLLLNDLISLGRNKGVRSAQRIPAGSVISRQQCLATFPGLGEQSISGAALWFDGFIEDTERLLLAVVHTASENGATVANYVTAEEYIMDDNRICGARVRDKSSGESFPVHARMIINATGSGIDSISADILRQSDDVPLSWVKGFNIFVNRDIVNDIAVGLNNKMCNAARDANQQQAKRTYFFVPWKGGTLIGTDYVTVTRSNDSASLSDTELESFIEKINSIYPDARIDRNEVSICHVGFLPANNLSVNADASLLKHTKIVDHEAVSGISGLFTVTGIKYTVAPQVAIGVIDSVISRLGAKAPRPADEPPLYGAEKEEKPKGALEKKLQKRYGCRFSDVMKLARADDIRRTVESRCETIDAEILYAIRHEMALTLSDVVFRRTGIGSTGTPSDETLQSCADIMASELGWNKARVEKEILDVQRDGQHCRN